ncbi:putative Bromo adjacent-like proteiny domain-containing 1 protein [Hypsibius exemplaris]|uniref:Bromo adjacent-like proteiny domain-containing 1 protein n=1 Tax=Hypsibius exemplaris TaxID=2072580 RepID=A0A1W0WSG4_HYPEX|nr:putative Bromo adjacent-like proteiny domain-containing 1 protein [Hypsibius exemplaris]
MSKTSSGGRSRSSTAAATTLANGKGPATKTASNASNAVQIQQQQRPQAQQQQRPQAPSSPARGKRASSTRSTNSDPTNSSKAQQQPKQPKSPRRDLIEQTIEAVIAQRQHSLVVPPPAKKTPKKKPVVVPATADPNSRKRPSSRYTRRPNINSSRDTKKKGKKQSQRNSERPSTSPTERPSSSSLTERPSSSSLTERPSSSSLTERPSSSLTERPLSSLTEDLNPDLVGMRQKREPRKRKSVGPPELPAVALQPTSLPPPATTAAATDSSTLTEVVAGAPELRSLLTSSGSNGASPHSSTGVNGMSRSKTVDSSAPPSISTVITKMASSAVTVGRVNGKRSSSSTVPSSSSATAPVKVSNGATVTTTKKTAGKSLPKLLPKPLPIAMMMNGVSVEGSVSLVHNGTGSSGTGKAATVVVGPPTAAAPSAPVSILSLSTASRSSSGKRGSLVGAPTTVSTAGTLTDGPSRPSTTGTLTGGPSRPSTGSDKLAGLLAAKKRKWTEEPFPVGLVASSSSPEGSLSGLPKQQQPSKQGATKQGKSVAGGATAQRKINNPGHGAAAGSSSGSSSGSADAAGGGPPAVKKRKLEALMHRRGEKTVWAWRGKSFRKTVYSKVEKRNMERTCYHAIRHEEGEVIKVGDCVLLRAPKGQEPHVGKVAAFWADERGDMMMTIFWFWRPEEVEESIRPPHGAMEVFVSSLRDENFVSCIDEKCFVLTAHQYARFMTISKYDDVLYRRPRRPFVPQINSPINDLLPEAEIDPAIVYFADKGFDGKSNRFWDYYFRGSKLRKCYLD